MSTRQTGGKGVLGPKDSRVQGGRGGKGKLALGPVENREHREE